MIRFACTLDPADDTHAARWLTRAQIARPGALPEHRDRCACDHHLAGVLAAQWATEGRYGAVEVRPCPT